jgi:hypothetical protein
LPAQEKSSGRLWWRSTRLWSLLLLAVETNLQQDHPRSYYIDHPRSMESMVVTKFELVAAVWYAAGRVFTYVFTEPQQLQQDWYEFDDVQVNPVMPEQAVAWVGLRWAEMGRRRLAIPKSFISLFLCIEYS